MTLFFDDHLHCPYHEAGGFLVGLEGEPVFKGTMNNAEVLERHNPDCGYIAFKYVTAENLLVHDNYPFLKYHPRREKYTPEQLIESIRVRQPKAVMIDTLNEPNWIAYDYWNVARTFQHLPFIFPHAGGYLINEFVKICHFQPNVWIDFSLTHTNYGSISANPLPYVDEAIRYALNAAFSKRLLIGSDYPFFDQDKVVTYYVKLGVIELLNSNFLSLFNQLRSL